MIEAGSGKKKPAEGPQIDGKSQDYKRPEKLIVQKSVPPLSREPARPLFEPFGPVKFEYAG
jgi:hypothetical protein